MASRLMSRSLISSARSAFQSSGTSFRAARGPSASSTTRPPSSSNRNPLRNDSTNLRRRWAETMIPLHDAVAGATLISHLAVNSRSRSALSLERCCKWIWEFCQGSIRGLYMSGENGEGQRKVQTSGLLLHSWKRLRSSKLLWHTVELPDDYQNFMNNEYDVASLSSDNFGNYAILSNFIAPFKEVSKDEKKDDVWRMSFDGASSRYGKGAGIVITSPSKQTFKFAFRLEFDASNNVAEYEALLQGNFEYS